MGLLLVVASELFGLTIAEWPAAGGEITIGNDPVPVDGNTDSEDVPETGIEGHRREAHSFDPANSTVGQHVNWFATFAGCVHRVRTSHARATGPRLINLETINLETINRSFRLAHRPGQVSGFFQERGEDSDPETAQSQDREGRGIAGPLYEALIRGYAGQHLQTDSKVLSAEAISRPPVPYTWNSRDFNDCEGLHVHRHKASVECIPERLNVDNRQGTESFDVSQRLNDSAIGKIPGIMQQYSRFAPRDEVLYYPVNTPEGRRHSLACRELAGTENDVSFGGRSGAHHNPYLHMRIDSTVSMCDRRLARRTNTQ